MNANASAAPVAVVPFLRKITPKFVAELQGINLLQLPRPVEPRHLYDLVGTVFSSTIKPDRSGTKADSVQFKGEFQACNVDTGEVYAESGVMYIPIMDGVLHTAVQSALEVDKKARVAVAFRVSIRTAPADKPSMTGYEFDVQRLIPTNRGTEDPITQLKRLAKETRAALPAPTPAVAGTSKEPESDAAPAQSTKGHRSK